MRSYPALNSKPNPHLPNSGQPICVCRLTSEPWDAARANVVTLLYFQEKLEAFKLNGASTTVEANNLLLLSPNAQLEDLNETVWRLSFDLDSLTFFEQSSQLSLDWQALQALCAGGSKVYSVKHPDIWKSTLKGLEEELTSQSFGYCESSKAHLAILNVQLIRLAKQDLQVFHKIRNPLVAKILGFINQNYAQQISLGRVAKTFYRSPAYLTTLFKEETGKSINDCIIDRRIEEAKRLLLQTNLSILEIGERVGYSEASHFSRLFRKRVGLSPIAFRKSEKKINLN